MDIDQKITYLWTAVEMAITYNIKTTHSETTTGYELNIDANSNKFIMNIPQDWIFNNPIGIIAATLRTVEELSAGQYISIKSKDKKFIKSFKDLVLEVTGKSPTTPEELYQGILEVAEAAKKQEAETTEGTE